MAQYRWCEHYPERYEKEKALLTQYQPSFKVIEEEPLVIIYRGDITVEIRAAAGMEKHTFCVDLVYPVSFPYSRIHIIPVKPLIRNSRHQAPGTGALCLMRDEPDDWDPNMTCLDVLQQAQRWFAGYVMGDFGPEIQVYELPLYFPKHSESIILLDDLDYVLPSPQHGQFKLSFGHLNQGRNIGFITEITKNHSPNKAPKPESVLQSAFSIDNGMEVKGAWYYLNQEPEPFYDFEGLLKQLTDNSDVGQRRIENQLRGLSKQGKTVIDKWGLPVGLYHPSHLDGSMQWLFIELQIPSEHKKNTTRRERLLSSEIKLIPSYPIRHHDLFRRVQPIFDTDHLSQKSVTIIGLGALGSPLAVSLVKAGVGRFYLFDGDKLKPGNIVRHTGGIEQVGQSKTLSVAWQMRQHNPHILIQRYGSIEKDVDQLRQCMIDSDLTIVAVANDNVEQFINVLAVELEQPVIYGYTLHQAQVGRIFKVIPHQTACRECLKYYKDYTDLWIEVPDADTEGFIYDDGCASPAIPGAGIDTDQVANLMARFTIKFLLSESGNTNHWIWVSQALQGEDIDYRLKQEMTLIPLEFEPWTECPICGDKLNGENKE